MSAGLGADFAPDSVMRRLPRLGSVDAPLDDTPLVAKWFSPYLGVTWYASEADVPGDRLHPDDTICCYGLIVRDGETATWELFDLRKLQGWAGMGGRLPLVERDVHFTPTTQRELRAAGRLP